MTAKIPAPASANGVAFRKQGDAALMTNQHSFLTASSRRSWAPLHLDGRRFNRNVAQESDGYRAEAYSPDADAERKALLKIPTWMRATHPAGPTSG